MREIIHMVIFDALKRLNYSIMALQPIANLILLCLGIYAGYRLIQRYFDPNFWDMVPWQSLLEIHHLSEPGVSDLLYCIGQESALAQQNMPILCALCGVAFPPVQDLTQPGLASVPTNAAPPTKGS